MEFKKLLFRTFNVSKKQDFSPCHILKNSISRLYCKIAYLADVDLNSLELISYDNIDNTAKFCDVVMYG